MEKNVLIIDDSALMRRVLSGIISKSERFKVAGIARDGKMALSLMESNPEKYDIILMDFFMPDMNGDELLHKMSDIFLDAEIILISGVIKEDAMEVIHALEHGVFDFVTKPNDFVPAKGEDFSERLLQCIELAANAQDDKHQRRRAGVVPRRTEQPVTINKTEKVKKKGVVGGEKLVALACSTGGPKALHQLVPKLPKNLDAPMVIVQHMPEGFTHSLAERLNTMSEVRVKEAEDGEQLKKGTVYIAKGGSQLRIKESNGQYVLRVTNEPARNCLRPCADIMYESLVGSRFDEIVCVVLTGMGGDGTAGIKQLNTKNNIYSIAQNAETCTVYGMPKVFYESGLVDEVLGIQDIAGAIARHVGVR